MEMHVVGITDAGTLDASDLSPTCLNTVSNPRVACFVAADPADVQALQSRLESKFPAFLLLNDEALAELKKLGSGISPVGRVSVADLFSRHQSPRGVRGWLLFLCLMLMVADPAIALYQAGYTMGLGLWNNLTVGLMFFVVYLLLVAGFGFTAGLFLLKRRRNAVTIAKWYFVATAVFDSVFYLRTLLHN